MQNENVLILFYLMWHFLVILALVFALSGVDELFIDVYFWTRYVKRWFKRRQYKPLTYQQLTEEDEQFIAILVPCWQEADVIGTMLRHNCYSIDYKNYYFFVGVYPNDSKTIAVVEEVAKHFPQVCCVIGAEPGPTNKAANLNTMYLQAKDFEKSLARPFSIYVFHDSEDVIHPLSFKLYNHLIPRKDMIQIPVFPLEVGYFNWTHWLYADEFSENHTKNIIVREAIKAHVPSAGVGTAFSAHALTVLATTLGRGVPFSVDSLTEDYRTSLALRMQHLKSIFVTQSVIRLRWVKKGIFKPRYIQKPFKEFVATRAMFPTEYRKAIRQKARWIIGIVFQEWDHNQWPKEWPIRYSLAHDRKSFITHFINGFSYIVFLFWVFYTLFTVDKPMYPSLQEQFNLHPWVWWLSVSVSLIMVERLIQRVIAIWKIYGWFPAVLAIPRAFYGNILNLHALIRAYKVYFSYPETKQKTAKAKPRWDKTENQFPARHILTPYRQRLGDLLVEQGVLNAEQLNLALIEHTKTGERLGTILQRMNLLSDEQLRHILSIQYKLRLFPKEDVEEAEAKCHPHLPPKILKWVRKRNLSVVEFDKTIEKLTIAIEDPTNELLLRKILRYFTSPQIEFVLLK
jgi:adsorption protein B